MLTPEDEVARGRRERWWRSAFIILATIYVGLLLMGLVIRILGGFTQIVLIVFVAWLLAFVLSPVVAWLTARRGISRGAAIGVTYAATLIGSGVSADVARTGPSVSMTWTRIRSKARGRDRAGEGTMSRIATLRPPEPIRDSTESRAWRSERSTSASSWSAAVR